MKKTFCFFSLIFTLTTYSQIDNDSKELKREKIIQNIGDFGQHFPALTSLVVIIVKKDKKGLWQFTKSYGITLGLTYALKYSINKPRPEGKTDGHAFPSGHTSVAFSGASFLQRRYGWRYGIPAYAVATFVAFSRLEGLDDRHDGWDVLGGAVIGIGSTYLFTTPYKKEHFELSFKSGKGDYLVGFTYKF